MTIARGSFDDTWPRPVIDACVAPSRHTFGFMGRHDRFTVSFFPPEHREDLQIPGTHILFMGEITKALVKQAGASSPNARQGQGRGGHVRSIGAEEHMMREIEKLDAGLEYDFWDEEVAARKFHAVEGTARLNAIPMTDRVARDAAIRELFGSVGENPEVLPTFSCDNGSNIHVGKNFLANYNVTILDVASVTIGDYVMIGPGTMISTVNHPLSPAGRRKHLGIAEPVRIGDDVWMGGNVTVLPGVTIGSNVVVGAGAVVTRDVSDNVVIAGVPAKVIRQLENDVEEWNSVRKA